MVLLNLLWGCVIFVVLFSVTFGSYCMLKRRMRVEGHAEKESLAVSLGNCFACGIFLSSCFLGLLPHIRKHEEHIRNLWITRADHSGSSSHIFLNSELIVLMGFLLILLLEEIVHIFHKAGSNGMLKYSTQMKRISASGKTFENILNTTAPSTRNATTSLRWSEDAELLFSDNNSTEDFTAQADNPVAIEFRQFSDEVVQKHSHGIYSHSGLLSSDMSLSAFVLLLSLSTHSVFEGIALGSSLISTEFYSLLIAIMIHEVLCSFALGVSLAQQNIAPRRAFMSSIVLASSIPMGISSSIVINSMETFTALLIRFVLEGFAAGAFIYVACVEMLSSELSVHERGMRQGLSKALAVITDTNFFNNESSSCGSTVQVDISGKLTILKHKAKSHGLHIEVCRILLLMAKFTFQKIIRVRNIDLAVLDESAYYETVYAGSSVPNRRFYAIESPFQMNSQASAVSEKMSLTNENKPKRKRKRGISSNICCDLYEVSIVLKKILERAVAMDAFSKIQCEPCSSVETALDFNNRLAQQLALTANSVPCPLSRYAKQQCFAKQNIKEIFLNEEKGSIDDMSNELIMWVNAEPKVITAECKGEKFILPPFSSFIINDVRVSRALIKYGKRFDFILLDPPWENKSVKRKTVYPTYGDRTWTSDLYVPELLTETGLFAIWVTNNARHFKFIDDTIEYFGFEKIATWRWLKVTRNGKPVYSLDSQHKQPFESIIFASSSAARKYYMKIVDEFVLISTPSVIHSRKPPLLPVLQALGILEESAEQLELYGRYLLPRTTTVGFEAAKLQNIRYFV
ncbi:unnamed protein product [Cercopithifilaria johnstoni]|uniref:Uncharacterized protein n=1 Tax=Cercopithifilaria johnstoni TaxID=2874296 RepID=A0A8J2M8M2_9BILA|nr:unnamed protein product [Cercopithifilaria johnstoni]